MIKQSKKDSIKLQLLIY